MAKRPTLTDLTSLTNSSAINTLSQNWDAIQTAFDNTLSLDGSTPNAMNADFDLNGNGLLNVGTIDVENLTLNGQIVTDLATIPEWRSAWVTATSYAKNDLVKTAGNVYICLVAHTSGTFATDLTALKWELMVSKGDSGAGTGDLVSTNNLNDVANPATSRSNLGLGTVAVENTVPIAKGGTGATDAATARTNLSAQTLNANLTSLSGITLVQGDLLYATGPDTLVRLAKGTADQVLQMNSGATAPKWGAKTGTWTTLASTPCNTGTSANRSGIATSATEIVIQVNAISTDSTGNVMIRLFESGVIKSSGYVSNAAYAYGSGSGDTTGFELRVGSAARTISGYVFLKKHPAFADLWFIETQVFEAGAAKDRVITGGYVTASNVDGVRLLTTTGNFDGSGAFVVTHN